MPLTAKFSEGFYRQFGHENVDELVDFLNQFDATYRASLRELNEQNALRFEAKLDALGSHVDDRLDARLAHLEGQFLRVVEKARADMIKWMFVFWTGTTIAVVGTILALN